MRRDDWARARRLLNQLETRERFLRDVKEGHTATITIELRHYTGAVKSYTLPAGDHETECVLEYIKARHRHVIQELETELKNI